MNIKPIIKYGNPLLLEKCEKVTQETENLAEIIQILKNSTYFYHGAGLSAIQIGEKLELFVGFINGQIKTFINCEILEQSPEQVKEMEGCLSLPSIYIPKLRPRWIKVRYLNEDFEVKEDGFEGFQARLICHEYEHAHQKFFLDEISQLNINIINQKIKKLKNKGKWDLDERTLKLIESKNNIFPTIAS